MRGRSVYVRLTRAGAGAGAGARARAQSGIRMSGVHVRACRLSNGKFPQHCKLLQLGLQPEESGARAGAGARSRTMHRPTL
jgi:hypothetical protein